MRIAGIFYVRYRCEPVTGSASLVANDPDVWAGGALQENWVRMEYLGLPSFFPGLDRGGPQRVGPGGHGEGSVAKRRVPRGRRPRTAVSCWTEPIRREQPNVSCAASAKAGQCPGEKA